MSKKIKYHFNIHSLSIEKVRITFKDRFKKIFTLVVWGLVFSFFVLFISFNLFNSPKEKMLAREIEQYKLKYEIMNDKLNNISLVLKGIENRDDNIYRVIFEADPVAAAIRNAGIGGANRYNELEGLNNSELVIKTFRKIDNISRRLYVQSKSFDDVFNMAKSKEDMMVHLPAILPISKSIGKIVSGFGIRFQPILKYRGMHTGIDIAAPKGTPIYATGDGVIVNPIGVSGYGIVCVINHGYGYQTLYGHMSKINVNPGQKIRRGEIIGFVGSTGVSTGSHVHYEVILKGQKINPVFFFYNDLKPKEYEKIIEKANEENQCLS
ncbi:MAG: M23 family metallopeptidase [Bacteroidales bacterium]